MKLNEGFRAEWLVRLKRWWLRRYCRRCGCGVCVSNLKILEALWAAGDSGLMREEVGHKEYKKICGEVRVKP